MFFVSGFFVTGDLFVDVWVVNGKENCHFRPVMVHGINSSGNPFSPGFRLKAGMTNEDCLGTSGPLWGKHLWYKLAMTGYLVMLVHRKRFNSQRNYFLKNVVAFFEL